MRIVCPSCAATYEVPDVRLVPGRAVRCSACAAGWTPRPLQTGSRAVPADDLPEPLPEPEPEVARSSIVPPVPAAVPSASPWIARVVAAGWVATVLILGGAAWAGIARRDSVMQAWPPTERLYAAIGLHHR